MEGEDKEEDEGEGEEEGEREREEEKKEEEEEEKEEKEEVNERNNEKKRKHNDKSDERDGENRFPFIPSLHYGIVDESTGDWHSMCHGVFIMDTSNLEWTPGKDDMLSR